MEPTIEFEWETFKEDDDTWDALFVRINNGRWRMTMPNFGTEDKATIINIIKSNPNQYND